MTKVVQAPLPVPDRNTGEPTRIAHIKCELIGEHTKDRYQPWWIANDGQGNHRLDSHQSNAWTMGVDRALEVVDHLNKSTSGWRLVEMVALKDGVVMFKSDPLNVVYSMVEYRLVRQT